MKQFISPHLAALARERMIGIAVPAAKGGSGGSLADLFAAVMETARRSLAAGRIYAMQRQFAEVLLACENIGLAEYRLGAILDGDISGACTATWAEGSQSALTGRPVGVAWRVSGALPVVPNVGAGWYLVTALLQTQATRSPFLVLLSSEQDGMHCESVAAPHAVQGDDSAALRASDVFFRADEILQEDASRISPYLERYSAFLRCAVKAGGALRAADQLDTGARAEARARVTRSANMLLDAVGGNACLPSDGELRTALASLHQEA